jgi:hypothetical protein
MPGTIFIGLVTHANSTFNSNGAPVRQLDQLTKELVKLGLKVSAVISDKNEFTENDGNLGLRDQVSAAYYQTKLESNWQRYIRDFSATSRDPVVANFLQSAGMFTKRVFQYMRKRSTLNRLMNIDLSHLRILREGEIAGADWILILEDDALAPSVEEAASAVFTTVSTLDPLARSFVNLSESFSTGSLGVQGIVENSKLVGVVNTNSELVEMPRPITNTVCANLYSSTFAGLFRQSIEANGLLPSLPIDWRLNKLIVEQPQQSIHCYWIQPGIFWQGSMQTSS